MDRWEHMAVNVRKIAHSGQVELRTISAPDYRPRPVDLREAPDTPSVWMLDRLGAEGWELVNVAGLEDGGTFWLRRRVAESGGGWAVSV